MASPFVCVYFEPKEVGQPFCPHVAPFFLGSRAEPSTVSFGAAPAAARRTVPVPRGDAAAAAMAAAEAAAAAEEAAAAAAAASASRVFSAASNSSAFACAPS